MKFLKFNNRLLTATFAVALMLSVALVLFQHRASDFSDDRVVYHTTDTSTELLESSSSTPKEVSTVSEIHTLSFRIKAGDTISLILGEIGIPKKEAYAVIEALEKIYDLRNLFVGQEIQIKYQTALDGHTHPKLSEFILHETFSSRIHVSKEAEEADYKASQVAVPLERRLVHISGSIENSLYESAAKEGIPANIIMELFQAYSYDVDFQREIRSNDSFEVLFERFYNEEGKTVAHGKILHASLNLSGRVVDIFHYIDEKGSGEYFNAEGRSVRKALLKTPINGARISSGYGVRKHPILGYSKMHQGVDFAAPRGTPIYAAGHGVVAEVGTKGGYGRYVRIHHNHMYDTAYAHISRYAKGLKKGMRVKQGQVIAYVGETGAATGPHLHYEIHQHKKKVNPLRVKMPSSIKLEGEAYKRFAAYKHGIDNLRLSVPFIATDDRSIAAKDFDTLLVHIH